MEHSTTARCIARIRRVTLTAAMALGLAAVGPAGVLADPLSGSNSTPGTLTCPELGLYSAATSGSPAARAVQLVGTNSVFIVQAAPDWGYAQAPGTQPKWVTCTLYEPGPGGVGTLTVLGYFSH